MSSADSWLPLGTAVVGAGAALAGGALSPLIGARRQHEHWLRDKRAELLERYFAILVEAFDEIEERQGIEAGLSGFAHSDANEEVQRELSRRDKGSAEILARLQTVGAAAELYVSPKLARAMRVVATTYGACYGSQPGSNDPEWLERSGKWHDQVHDLLDRIRGELGVT